MVVLQPKRLRYGEYAFFLIIAVLGLSGVLYFGGVTKYGIKLYVSLLLASLGVYTLAFVFYYLKFIRSYVRNYMFLWGYILASIGFALFLDLLNHNLFLNISITVLIGALLGFASVRYAGRQ
ncbi:MAG: hypothetical protein ABSB40_01280 [Nitrososphaeria archaeon]|jgi:hypothetical protein